MHQSFEPPPHPVCGYPGQTGGFHLVFTQFRFPVVEEYTFFRGFAIQCGGWVGVWREFHSWFATFFRRMGSGCNLPRRRSYGFVTQSFLSHERRSWGRNAWRTPKNVCVGGYSGCMFTILRMWQSFLSHERRSWGRNAWRTPKNVCVGGYSGCMFTILRMWQTECMTKDARSSGSPLLVREDGRGVKVNTPGIPQLGGGWRGGSNDWCITCCFISKGNTRGSEWGGSTCRLSVKIQFLFR